MILTEDEAQKTLCPLLAIGGSTLVAAGASMDAEGQRATMCNTTHCTMWRWHDQQAECAPGMTWRCEGDDPALPGWSTEGQGAFVECLPRRGYCGLAGDPRQG